jgi:hypothetical protein
MLIVWLELVFRQTAQGLREVPVGLQRSLFELDLCVTASLSTQLPLGLIARPRVRFKCVFHFLR